jgi:hypothetical protein
MIRLLADADNDKLGPLWRPAKVHPPLLLSSVTTFPPFSLLPSSIPRSYQRTTNDAAMATAATPPPATLCPAALVPLAPRVVLAVFTAKVAFVTAVWIPVALLEVVIVVSALDDVVEVVAVVSLLEVVVDTAWVPVEAAPVAIGSSPLLAAICAAVKVPVMFVRLLDTSGRASEVTQGEKESARVRESSREGLERRARRIFRAVRLESNKATRSKRESTPQITLLHAREGSLNARIRSDGTINRELELKRL